MLQSKNRSAKRIYFVEDFHGFGERYGIEYRFPQLQDARASASPVLHGDVEEMMLSSGIALTHSDVRVLQPYETTSRHNSPLYMLVVLDGCVTLSLNGHEYRVGAGMAFSSRLSEEQVMSAHHDADSTLKTLSFGVYPGESRRECLLESVLLEWQNLSAPTFVWHVPGFVLTGIQHAQQDGLSAVSRKLLLEGLMYQLLGHGLNQRMQNGPNRPEHTRLERVRSLLEQAPEQNHTLTQLAALAAMSQSSLRSKFRQRYGCALFDYLRDCRWPWRVVICWKALACSRRRGCAGISMPRTSRPRFAATTVFHRAMCVKRANAFSSFLRTQPVRFVITHT